MRRPGLGRATAIVTEGRYDTAVVPVNYTVIESVGRKKKATADASTQSSETIHALFDRIAPVYDDFNQQLSWGLHRVWKQMAVDWSAASADHTCLDVCCGSGDLALLLAKRVGPAGQVYGVDFSTAQLAIAQDKAAAQRQELGSLHWVAGNALALPFAEATFDAATMGYGLRNLTDIPKGLRELHRVLKPGARAAVLDFNRPQIVWMQQFQDWYLDQVVVTTAKQYGLTDEYAYISPSLARFPPGDQQVQLGLAAGFSAAIHYGIAGGLMGVLVLTR